MSSPHRYPLRSQDAATPPSLTPVRVYETGDNGLPDLNKPSRPAASGQAIRPAKRLSKRRNQKSNASATRAGRKHAKRDESDESGSDSDSIDGESESNRKPINKNRRNTSGSKQQHTKKKQHTQDNDSDTASQSIRYLIFALAIVLLGLTLADVWSSDSTQSRGPFSNQVRERLALRAKFEAGLDAMLEDSENQSLARQMKQTHPADVYSLRDALGEFGEHWLTGGEGDTVEDFVEESVDDHQPPASLQIASDSSVLLDNFATVLSKMLKSVVARDVSVVQVDLSKLLDQKVIPYINSYLTGEDLSKPIVFIVRNYHVNQNVMQLKEHLEQAYLQVTDESGKTKTVRTLQVGFLLLGAGMDADACTKANHTVDEHDLKQLRWFRSFVGRIGLKARLCST